MAKQRFRNAGAKVRKDNCHHVALPRRVTLTIEMQGSHEVQGSRSTKRPR
jgi:hypothetical protein